MFDVGDPVPLSVTVRDNTQFQQLPDGTWIGAPANATLVVLTVTAPDGTTSTPAVANPSAGVYTATGPSSLTGRYGVRWVATGANASSYTDAYDVDDVTPASIASLYDVKQRLNIRQTSTQYDDELRRVMRGAISFFERWLGPVARQIVTTVGVKPDSDGTLNLKGNILSVTTITDTYGFGYTYTPANYLVSGNQLRPLAYTWAGSRYPVTVVHVGGWTEIPGDLREAYLDYIAWKWESQRGPAGTEPGAQGPADEFDIGTPPTVPFQIMEVIDGYRQKSIA